MGRCIEQEEEIFSYLLNDNLHHNEQAWDSLHLSKQKCRLIRTGILETKLN